MFVIQIIVCLRTYKKENYHSKFASCAPEELELIPQDHIVYGTKDRIRNFNQRDEAMCAENNR